MTVIGLVRGNKGTYNAMVADAGVGAFGGKRNDVECEHDKIRLLFGSTYVAAIGDALVLDSLQALISWLDPKRPNLREAATFDAILVGLERLRTVRTKNGHAVVPNPGCAQVIVCSRESVFYWKAEYDVVTGRFVRPPAPTEVQPGNGVVLWGIDTTVRLLEMPTTPRDPFSPIIDHMLDANARCESLGYRLPYRLTRRCSGVVLPHKTSEPVQRMRPFANLPEQWIKYNGGPAELLLDDDFMAFPLPNAR